MNEEIIEGEVEEIVGEGMSPTPQKAAVEMDFPDALREVIAGKKITKLEWCNKEVYVELRDEKLEIMRDNGKYYHLLLSEGDIKGEDFVVID